MTVRGSGFFLPPGSVICVQSTIISYRLSRRLEALVALPHCCGRWIGSVLVHRITRFCPDKRFPRSTCDFLMGAGSMPVNLSLLKLDTYVVLGLSIYA